MDDPPNDKIVKLRKTEVTIDGEPRIIVQIRDFSDSINLEKIQLQQKEDNARQDLVSSELD